MAIIKTTLDPLPSNIQIVNDNGYPTPAFVFYLLKILKRSENDVLNLQALSKEIDNTQLGAGLSTDGSYKADLTAHYISSSTSLFVADTLLDMGLNYLQIEVNAIQTGAGLAANGSYIADSTTHYLSLATSLKNADNKLDVELFNHETLYTAHGSNGNIVGFNDTSSETLYGLVKRCALISNVAMATTVITTADIAAAPSAYDQTYTNTMASLINENKAKLNSIVTDLGNVVTTINNILAKMKIANQMTT